MNSSNPYRTVLLFAALGLGFVIRAVFPNAGSQVPSVHEDPFSEGERMTFTIRWHPPAWLFFIPSIYAGQTTFEAKKAAGLIPGKDVWQLTARAESSGTLVSMTGMKVNDYYESWMDPQDLCSYRIFKKIREGKRQRDVEVIFERGKGSLTIKETDISQSPPKEIRNQEITGIPSCVQDVLSIFYSVRSQHLETGKGFVFTLSDNGRTRQIQARVEKEERVETPLGVLPSFKVRTQAVFGGLFREGGELTLWVHKDKVYPVRFEAKVKFGRVFGGLAAYTPR